MRIRVDGNRVRVRHGKRAHGDKGLSVLTKNSHVSGFRRDIQLLESRIEREYVWVFSDWVRGQYLHICEIDHCKFVVFLSCHKSQSRAHIEGNRVRAFKSRDWIAPDNLGIGRVNRYSSFFSWTATMMWPEPGS